jgi:hypothetical protein
MATNYFSSEKIKTKINARIILDGSSVSTTFKKGTELSVIQKWAINFITKDGKLPELLGAKYKEKSHKVELRSEATGRLLRLISITA